MPVEQDQRPQYFQGQYLGPEDLTAAVEYGRIQHERHSLGAHSWGIAIGLQVVEKPSPAGNNQVDVFLSPGYAWDGFGRSIVGLAPYKIPADLFKSIVFDAAIDGGKTPGRLVKVWVRYRESASRPPLAGFEVCDVADQNSRILETFQVEVGERPNASDQRDPLSIAGKQVDALTALQLNGFDPGAPEVYDLSIPHQAFPEDDATASWLVPVGYVRWLPNQIATMLGSFQQRNAQDKAAGNALRQYIGVVAGAVLAPGNNVRIRDRSTDPTLAALSDDLLWVEGGLRVQEKDLRLFGGRLSFLDNAGQDNNGIPLMLQRSNQAGSSSLQAVIGKGHDGKNTFAVGPLDPNSKDSFVPRLTVQDDGNVGIGTPKPSNPLHVDDVLGIRQKYLYLSGDQRGSSVSYNAHRDSANQHWVFPDPTHAAVTIEMDDAFGFPRFEVWSKPATGNDDWTQRFAIKGDSGDVFMGHHGGNVAIGTATPGAKLHVAGGDIMWGNNSRLVPDQGGSIELGGDNTTKGTGTPYIDFHFQGLAQDFNTRIINDADGQLSLIAPSVRAAGTLTVLASRTYLLGIDGSAFHWIMVGGSQEGVNNALGFQYLGVNNGFLHTGPGWTKGFLIHHPLQPRTKYLAHATLEGPEAAVFYRGEAQLSKGKATVHLPDYFEALTSGERRTVLVTPISVDDAPVSLLAVSEVKNGSFTVKSADLKNESQRFYWEVKAVRADVAEVAVVADKSQQAAPTDSSQPTPARRMTQANHQTTKEQQ